jgi:hypothetical protein
MSHNGRHTICRDIGLLIWEQYWETLPVEKVICSEFENKIYLRGKKKILKHPVIGEISGAFGRLGYPEGTKIEIHLISIDPIMLRFVKDQALLEDCILARPEGEADWWKYNIQKHTFVN